MGMDDSTLQTIALWAGIVSAALSILGFAWRNRGLVMYGILAVIAFGGIGALVLYGKHSGRVFNHVGDAISPEHGSTITLAIVGVGALFLLLALFAVFRGRRA